MYFTARNTDIKALIRDYGMVNRTKLAPKVNPSNFNLRIITIEQMMDVCVYIPKEEHVYLIPSRNDYLEVSIPADWKNNYRNSPHKTQLQITKDDLEKELREREKEDINFTYKN